MCIKNFLKQKKLNENHKSAISATLAMGIGIMVGFLVAPKSGKEMRKDVCNTLEKTANTFKSTVAGIKESITNTEGQIEKNIKDAADEIKDNLNKTVDDVSAYAVEAKNKLKLKITNADEAVEEKAEQLKKEG